MSGQLDLLLFGDEPCVIDHKTGSVVAEGEPIQRYRRQLAVYAWLADVALGLDIAGSALFSLHDGVVSVDTSRSTRESVMAEVLDAQDRFNDRVPGPQLANPSVDACMYCPFVGECDEAWSALRTQALERLGRGESVVVEVSGELVVAANGSMAIPIRIEAGSVVGKGMLVDVPGPMPLPVMVGSRLRCWGLALRSAEPLALAWRPGVSGLASDEV